MNEPVSAEVLINSNRYNHICAPLVVIKLGVSSTRRAADHRIHLAGGAGGSSSVALPVGDEGHAVISECVASDEEVIQNEEKYDQ